MKNWFISYALYWHVKKKKRLLKTDTRFYIDPDLSFRIYYFPSGLIRHDKTALKSKFLESYRIIMYHFYRNKEEEEK